MKPKLWKYTAIALASLMVTGCVTMKNDRYYVQREWASSMREQGIVPFFPPREDVYVGDVYAYGYNPEDADIEAIFLSDWESLSKEQQDCRRTMGMSPRLSRLGGELSELIHAEYEQTLSAPKTTANYDSIVGNPARQMADSKLKAAQEKLRTLQKAVDDANEKVGTLTAEKQQRTWAVEKTQKSVNLAEADLNAAKAAPLDVSAEQASVDRAALDVISKEDAKLKAQRDIENLPSDAAQASKEAASRALVGATRDLEDAQTLKRRAEERLIKAQARPRDLSNQIQALSVATKAKIAADEALVEVDHQLTLAIASAEKIRAESAEKINSAKNDVTSAEALLKAITDAGAGLLISQPRDQQYSIYKKTIENASIPDTTTADDTFGSRTNRLRLVGFPEFTSASFSQGDLSTLIPIEAMGFGANFSRSSIDRISVKIPSAESYSLSAAKLVREFLKKSETERCKPDQPEKWLIKENTTLGQDIPFVDAVVNRGACSILSSSTPSKLVYLHIITEVYYARALDISLYSSDSFGMRAQIAFPTSTIGAQTTPTDPSNLPTMTPATLDVDKLDSATATALLAKLQSRLGTTQTVPGGSIQVVNFSERSIGLRRVFDRPIAIGMRGVVIKYDPVTNKAELTGPISTTNPKNIRNTTPE